jgi:hypothetical protein
MRIQAQLGGQDRIIELPDGATPEQIDEVLNHASNQFGSPIPVAEQAPVQPEPAPKDFLQRLGDDFDERRAKIENIRIRQKLWQPYTEQAKPNEYRGQGLNDISGALQQLGQYVGGGYDILGQGALSLYNAIPESVKDNAVGRALGQTYREGNLLPGVESLTGVKTSPEAILGAAGQTVGAGYKAAQQYAPDTVANLEAIAAIAPVTQAAGRGVGAVGTVGKAVGMAGRAAAKALTPSVQEGLVDVALSARKFDIPLSLDQVTGSRALKNVQKVSQELPFSGQQGFREAQMRAYNKALFKTVGVEADAFTPKNMALAFDKVGGEFDAVTKGKTFGIGGNFIDDLAATAEDVRSQYGDEAFNAFQREASKVISDFQGDSISGELISRQRGRINALARKASPGQKEALLDLENTIVDGITSGDPAIEAALSQAKQRYKNLIVLEPVATKAKGGMISPSLLNNRVASVYKRAYTLGNSGDIGELARVGYELLPELGGSDTTQKLLTAGAAGSMLSNPVSIAPLAVGVGSNRAFQSAVNRNQSLVNAAIKKSEAEQLKRLTKQDLQKAFEAKKKLPMTDTFLDMPPIPTPEQMKKFSTVQKVSLSDVEGNQRVREFDKFNKGIFAEPLIAGYSDMPVAVKFKNGKYLLLDGHHRTDIALNKGKFNMEMRVIEAKDYTNIDRKPIKESKFTAEDADILEKLLKE